jgi:hypothetical protein
MTLKQGPNLGYRPKNGVRVGLSAQKGGHSWVISPKTGSELGYRPKNGFFYFYVVAKWYIRQMAHSPNGSFAKWYIRQMVHSPISTQASSTYSRVKIYILICQTQSDGFPSLTTTPVVL